MPAILEVHDLVKHYGEIHAVDHINFHIEQGEIFSLLGPNGAGKTTTISILSTLIPPTSGDATIGGFSITRQPDQVRALLGMVPQDIALYEDLTAEENLRFWGNMYDLSGSLLSQRVADALKRIGLTDRAKDKVKTFSGGMKRRVNIAAGLLHQPRLLFMDEPTVGIDPQSRRAILDMVKALNAEGMTILYTTHYMEEAQELSDRVGIIDQGKLIALGTQAELTRQVGETDTIVLHVDRQDQYQPVLDAILTVPGTLRADSAEDQISVITADAEEVLAPVITAATASGARIRSVDIHAPNLETVFLHLTGRALRD